MRYKEAGVLMRLLLAVTFGLVGSVAVFAQEGGFRTIEDDSLIVREPTAEGDLIVPVGTRVPLVLLNSISTKHAAPGDLIYLESVFPVVVDGRIVMPPGTYVSGSVTKSKRSGRLKGRGELYVRFERLILPNGVIRDLVYRFTKTYPL